MSIRVVCRNGHILNVKDSLAGKIGLCPTCKARVRVPSVSRNDLSEDAIMNILGPPKASPGGERLVQEMADAGDSPTGSETDQGSPPLKSCEKCNQLILAATHICPYCHTYIGKLEDF